MAQDKQLSRIEAKLDALLKKGNIDPAKYGEAAAKTPSKPTELTEAQKQAIANAPKYIEAKATGSAAPPLTTEQATVPSDAVGKATVVTEQPDGQTTTEVKPVSEVKK